MLLALIACKEKPPDPAPAPPPPLRDGVTLLQAGAPPHQVLRYRPIEGARTRSELVCDVDLRSDDHTGPLPTLVVDFETEVTGLRADGTAQLRLTVMGTTVRERPGSTTSAELVRAEAATMQGVVITQTLAADGTLGEPRIEPRDAVGNQARNAAGSEAGSEARGEASSRARGPAPGDAPAAPGPSDQVRAQLDSLTRSLQQVAMRLPVEPVGLGAVWIERKTLPEGGIRAMVETTYTLTSLAGDTIGFTATGVASGGAHAVEQDGMRAEITGTRGSSEAKGTVDLGRYAIAVRSTSKLATTMSVVAPPGTRGAEPSTVEVTMAVQVTPSSAPAQGAQSAP